MAARLPDLYAAVMEGAVERVRPKMMTVIAIMVGGMISSTLLTLIVIPATYAWVKGKDLR